MGNPFRPGRCWGDLLAGNGGDHTAARPTDPPVGPTSHRHCNGRDGHDPRSGVGPGAFRPHRHRNAVLYSGRYLFGGLAYVAALAVISHRAGDTQPVDRCPVDSTGRLCRPLHRNRRRPFRPHPPVRKHPLHAREPALPHVCDPGVARPAGEPMVVGAVRFHTRRYRATQYSRHIDDPLICPAAGSYAVPYVGPVHHRRQPTAGRCLCPYGQ